MPRAIVVLWVVATLQPATGGRRPKCGHGVADAYVKLMRETVLDAVSAELTTEDLIRLNTEASGNSGINPDEAAANWVREHGFDQPLQP